jgi:hypothetical protein
MDRNTIPNINTTSFAFEQNIKYNHTARQYTTIPNIYNTTSFAFEISTLHCNANDSLIN